MFELENVLPFTALRSELIVLSLCLLASLIHTAVSIPLLHNWRVSRPLALGMLGFYIVFSVIYALIAAGVIFQTQWT
jgi:Ca2+/Na+ antiporter